MLGCPAHGFGPGPHVGPLSGFGPDRCRARRLGSSRLWWPEEAGSTARVDKPSRMETPCRVGRLEEGCQAAMRIRPVAFGWWWPCRRGKSGGGGDAGSRVEGRPHGSRRRLAPFMASRLKEGGQSPDLVA